MIILTLGRREFNYGVKSIKLSNIESIFLLTDNIGQWLRVNYARKGNRDTHLVEEKKGLRGGGWGQS